jgi:NAD(P)-dependent dehydrogenase (short-subunit alcohol dehydrogenase family)
MSLEKKVGLISGAGTGIGADAARAFHNAGEKRGREKKGDATHFSLENLCMETKPSPC